MTEPARRALWRRDATAVVADYALALQALLGVVGGALDARATREGVGSLCRAEGGSRPAQAPSPHPDLCCTLACHAGADCAPAAEPALLHRTLQPAGACTPRAWFVEADARLLLPLGARAPPAAR